MARLRKFAAYRRLERPYTRVSKYREKSYVRMRPHSKVVRYVMGDPKKDFPVTLYLVAKNNLQIRHNAIEAARLTAVRLLELNLGKTGFFYRIRMFPHHILRENPLASGAGADRMSQGMSLAFGKPIGCAARVKKGYKIMEVGVEAKHLNIGKQALVRASKKIPCKWQIVIKENK